MVPGQAFGVPQAAAQMAPQYVQAQVAQYGMGDGQTQAGQAAQVGQGGWQGGQGWSEGQHPGGGAFSQLGEQLSGENMQNMQFSGGSGRADSNGFGGNFGGGAQGWGALPTGVGMLERQMSATTISADGSNDGSPPQGSMERLYVSNLPRTFTEADVAQLFQPYGSLTEVSLHKKGDGASRGCFFVSFATAAEGHAAWRSLNNVTLANTPRPMQVRPSTSRRRDHGAGRSNGNPLGASSGFAHGGAMGGGGGGMHYGAYVDASGGVASGVEPPSNESMEVPVN